jgi:hypothetical protein
MLLQYRQGDLLFLQQDSWPTATLVARTGTVIVAGEITGHAHFAPSGAILEAPDGALYLDLAHTTRVVHEAYGPLTLEPGLWLVVRKPENRPGDFDWTVVD